jgi:hypothetical protein
MNMMEDKNSNHKVTTAAKKSFKINWGTGIVIAIALIFIAFILYQGTI